MSRQPGLLTRETVHRNLDSVGLRLPTGPVSRGSYEVVRIGAGIATTSALGPFSLDGSGGFSHSGRIGSDLTTDEALEAAAITGLTLIAALDNALDLSLILGAIELNVYLRTADGFEDHAAVADGVSSILIAAFGGAIGSHARTVFGVMTLPFGLPIVASLSVQVADDD